MKSHAMSFSSPMVRAILDDRKNTTRRPAKGKHFYHNGILLTENPCPYQVGDHIWAKETYGFNGALPESPQCLLYKATTPDALVRWHSGRFMRREYSRIELEIAAIHLETLTDITNEAALDEGIEYVYQIANQDWSKVKEPTTIMDDPRHAFLVFWNHLYAARPWMHARMHPPVWVYQFEKVKL